MNSNHKKHRKNLIKHIVIKLLKTSNRETLKAAIGKKKHIEYRGTKVNMMHISH